MITFDGNFDTTGNQALGQGVYTLTISDNVQDVFGNALDGNLDGLPLGNYVFNFTIDILGQGGTIDDPMGDSVGGTTQQNGRTYPETPVRLPSMPMDITSSLGLPTTPPPDTIACTSRSSTPTALAADLPALGIDSAPVTPVTSGLTISFDQRFSSVACDADGDFVVTWTEIHNGNADVYARRFNSMGQPIRQFLPRQHLYRRQPTVVERRQWTPRAISLLPGRAIGQEKTAQPGLGYGVYATRYNSSGQVDIPEFQVNIKTSGDQFHSSVTLTNDGWFVVTFEGAGVQANTHDIFVRLFSPTGSIHEHREFTPNVTSPNSRNRRL